jgi:hypothetical protein
MHFKRTGLGGSPYRRIGCLAASLTAILAAVCFGPMATSVGAAVPEKTDIMFIFDTSGSMGGTLNEAKAEIEKVIAETSASIPNTAYGVANVEDVPGNESGEGLAFSETEEEYANDDEKPWRLDQPVTTEQAMVKSAIDDLTVGSTGDGGTPGTYGGDGPEAYGRALWETDTNPQVGWRPGARHEIVLIGDQVPHTPNVNEGIPEEFWSESPFDTGEEPGGRFGIPDTQWKEGESLEFHKTLEKLAVDGKPLAMVDYHDTEGEYIHYWEYWAAQTGGQALEAHEGGNEFGSKLVAIVKESTGRALPPCPTGYEPRVNEEACVPVPPPTSSSTPGTTKTTGPSTTPPTSKTVTIEEEDGEIDDEYEFDEPGEADFSGEVDDGAEAARFEGLQAGAPQTQLVQQMAFVAKKGKSKSKGCKKGYVKKGKKCVDNAPLLYGSVKMTIPAPGRYRFKIKPTGKVLAALKKGKTLNVKLKLEFIPAGTTTPILNTTFVKVHLKKPKKKGHRKPKKK